MTIHILSQVNIVKNINYSSEMKRWPLYINSMNKNLNSWAPPEATLHVSHVLLTLNIIFLM